jgi:hypothetical protein
MRATILIALAFGALLRSDGIAQERPQPGCAEVAKDIDRYADREVSLYGRINSIEVREGAILVVFACTTTQGEVVPGAFFGIAMTVGTDSVFSPTAHGDKRLRVTGRVLSTEAKLFRSPPSFSGPYLHRPTVVVADSTRRY